MENKIVCPIHIFLIVLVDEAAVFAALCVLCVALYCSVRRRCDEGYSSGTGVMMSALRAACGCLFCLSCPKLMADRLNQRY